MNDELLTKLEAAAKAAKERADKATPGPWFVGDGTPEMYHSGPDEIIVRETVDGFLDDMCVVLARANSSRKTYISDAAFIASARSDVPVLAEAVVELVAEVRRFQAKNQNLRNINDDLGLSIERWRNETYELRKTLEKIGGQQ